MDHESARCATNELAIAQLNAHRVQSDKDLDMVVERTQNLVDEYHEIRVTLARLESEVSQLRLDVADLKSTVRDKVAGREEFLTVRNQLWAGIGVIVLGVLGAVIGFAMRGGFVGR